MATVTSGAGGGVGQVTLVAVALAGLLTLVLGLALHWILPPRRDLPLPMDFQTTWVAIALALGCERPGWTVTGVDRISAAVQLAERNRARIRLGNVRFLESRWFSALGEQR